MATATSPRTKYRHGVLPPALLVESQVSSLADSGGVSGKRRSRTLERYLAIPVFGTGCSPHCGAFLRGRAGTRTLNGPAGRYSLSGRAPRLAGPLPWPPRLESNQWPPRSERGALSAELQGGGGRRGNT